jgi:hypothetical protein
MSIFRSSFRDYVKKQLNVRRLISSRGSTTNNAPDFYEASDAIDRSLGSNFGPNGLDLDMEAGAFYTYTHNKSCVIRMTSMTDYVEDVGIDIGLERPLSEGGDYVRPFKTIKGATLARNFVLQGGVLSDFATNAGDGQRKVKPGKNVRGGFPQSGKTLNTSYGDASIGANNSDDGYGIVPMPGIVDANIRTKSAYGSLREAKVNFVVHNRRQLEVLEMLYMRPGYAVLLEWGWSPYINNKGKIESSLNVVQDEIGEDVLFSNQVTQDLLFNTIKQLKENQDGNYDGMLGYVKNFGFSQNNEGAYNCFIELISLGEVLDSLKSPNQSTLNTKAIEFKTSGSLQDFGEFNTSTIGGLLGSLDLLGDKLQLKDPFLNFGSDSTERFYGTGENEFSDRPERTQAKEDIKDFIEGLGIIDQKHLNSFIFSTLIDQESRQDGDFVGEARGNTYIRWDLLCFLLNKLFINVDENNEYPTFLSPDKVIDRGGDEIAIQPLLYTPNYHPDPSKFTILDASTDSSICILPHQFKNAQEQIDTAFRDYTRTRLRSNSVKNLSDTALARFSVYLKNLHLSFFDFSIYNRYVGQKDIVRLTADGEEIISQPFNVFKVRDAQRRIGNIFISVEMLKSLVQGKTSDEITLGSLVKDIWGKINEACPLHNFVVSDDSEGKYSYVYDLGVDLGIAPTIESLYEFQPGTNQTTVRDYDIQSTVPSSLSSTIAIQAQDPDGIRDIDGVTFRAFNASIRNRLLSTNTISLSDQIASLRENLLQQLAEQVDNIEKYLALFFVQLVGSNLTTKYTSDEGRELYDYMNPLTNFRNIKGNLKGMQVNVSQLLTQDYKTPSAASVIPLSINMTIDGIGGIVKGHMFKIEPDRLPKAYEKSNIGFITFGEEQMITVGGDWTTKLEGKMTILPDTSNKPALKKGNIEDFKLLTDFQQEQGVDFSFYWSKILMKQKGPKSLYWYLKNDRAELRTIQQRDYPQLPPNEFPTNKMILLAYYDLYREQFSSEDNGTPNEIVYEGDIDVLRNTPTFNTSQGNKYFIYDYETQKTIEYELDFVKDVSTGKNVYQLIKV